MIWGQVLADSEFPIMAYDLRAARSWLPDITATYVAVEGTVNDEVAGYWDKLTVDAEIIQPLQPSKWSPLSGMVKDQFGVVWVLSVVTH